MQQPTLDELFEERLSYPDITHKDRFDSLVGLDDKKELLVKMLGVLINPDGLDKWVKKYHKKAQLDIATITKRPHLIVFSGDVGSGKTALAETIGDAVARQEKIDINLFPMSLSARGQGRVGEMTQLISSAFSHTIDEAKKLKSSSGKPRGGIILLVDEADALAQSREASQMHHEDRAGVNAFIRGIDRLNSENIPAAVIMCTNRLGALDPAIKRRAADILAFHRPNQKQRNLILAEKLKHFGFSDEQIKKLVLATGECNGRDYGFTYSDITLRLLPKMILDAYPSNPIDPGRALEVTKEMNPTPPFEEKL